MLVEKNDNTPVESGQDEANAAVSSLSSSAVTNTPPESDAVAEKLNNSSKTAPKIRSPEKRRAPATTTTTTSNNNTTSSSKTDGPVDKEFMHISAYGIQGRRSHMEDYFDIGYQMKPASEQRPNEWPYEYFYFGIFDGHGGHEAAMFAKQSLLKMIVRQAAFWSDDDEDVMRAIRQGFADTHSAMREKLSTWTRNSKLSLPSTAGTTASVLFIKNGKFYTGHVGDSRIVISRSHPETDQWISHQVTEDHKPELKSETERIERAGGEVKSKFGVPRVVWRRPVWKEDFDARLNAEPKTDDYADCIKQIETYPVEESVVNGYQIIPFLAIARSLGDFWSINPQSGQFIVSPEPDVACRPIDENDKCILLATDGLWNVVNSPQAVRFLQEINAVKSRTRQRNEYLHIDNFYDVRLPEDFVANHAMSLVYLAYQIWERRRLRSDNITAVVAMISDIIPPAKAQTPSRINTRRSSREHVIEASKILIKEKYIADNTRQLDFTNIFREKITSGAEPKLLATPLSETEVDIFQKIEEHLIFPPTMFRATYEGRYVVGPNNYEELTFAHCRRILVEDRWHEYDSFIYMKYCSDDPDDRWLSRTRINRKGKEVRDSSCQATQPIHDFGQPWDQLDPWEPLEFDDGYDRIRDERYVLVRETELKVGDIIWCDYEERSMTVDVAYLERMRERHERMDRRKRRRVEAKKATDDTRELLDTIAPHERALYEARSDQTNCV